MACYLTPSFAAAEVSTGLGLAMQEAERPERWAVEAGTVSGHRQR
jgi:hypothetical protein